jgi:hypothetical protein
VVDPQVVAPIQSVTPESLFGWGGFVFGLGAFVILIWDRITGRTKNIVNVENKIDGLCDQVADMEGELKVVDGLATTVRELVFEWRGIDGENGYKSIIRENSRRIFEIEKRNTGIDAVRKAHDDDLRRSGGQQRRQSDRELNNLLPEDREEKG